MISCYTLRKSALGAFLNGDFAIMPLMALFIGLVLLPSAAAAPADQGAGLNPDITPPALFSSLEMGAGAGSASPRDRQVVRWRQVGIRSDLLTNSAGLSPDQLSEQQVVFLNLFDDAEFVAEPTQVERNARGVKWAGRLQGISLSQVIFAVNGDEVFGSISMPGRRFQLRSVGNGIHELQEINTQLFSADRLSTDTLPQGVVAQKSGPYSTVTTTALPDGTLVDALTINGPPTPPEGFEIERQAVNLPEPNIAASVNTITVPAYTWVFGCSSVSGAMIAGYYDRNGYPNMYTGPTNGGVMPLDNSSWPTWTDVHGDVYPNLPLAASHNGVDGRATRGSIDDYWVQYGSTASDPYITGGWTQHTWGDAIGDYMKTSQSAYGNTDGSTMFYNYSSGSNQLTCATMASQSLADGTLGRELFYQARGYTVTDCYNQKTDNQVAGGFSFVNYKAQIDAGHPVMLNLNGHTIAGVGYDDSTNTVYLHDTWDYNTHTMVWGTSYSGMALLSVSVVNLAASTSSPIATTLVSPTGTITTTTPSYVWNAVSNSTSYYLWVNDPTGTKIQTWYTAAQAGCSSGTGTCSVTPSTALASGAGQWWVETSNTYGNGPWSSSLTFTVSTGQIPAAATLVSPTGTITTTTPTYVWNAVSNATSYYLWVNDSAGTKIQTWYTATQAGCSSGTGTCSVAPSTALASGAGQWWIETSNTYGNGPWSNPLSFTVQISGGTPPAATLVSPTGTITTATPTYTWNAVSTSTWYYLWVNDSTGNKIQTWYTAAQAGCSSGTGTCSVTPSTTLASGAGQWWVQTWNTYGYGPWSNPLSFTVQISGGTPPAATLVSPTGTITTATPTYTWNAVSTSTWYYLWVNDSTGNKIQTWYTAAQAGCSSGTGTCSVTPSTTLASGAGQWWVATWNTYGYGPWSNPLTFTVSLSGGGFNSQFNGDATNWYYYTSTPTWNVNSNYLYTNGSSGVYASIFYGAVSDTTTTYSNFDYQARIWRDGCNGCANGIMLRGSPNPLGSANQWDHGYYFVYNRNGSYSIWRLDGGVFTALVTWTASSYINTGSAWNTLRVVAQGTTIYFYINGNQVATVTSSTYTSGKVGLIMYSDGTSGDTYWVDWATLTTLTSSSDPGEASTDIIDDSLPRSPGLDAAGVGIVTQDQFLPGETEERTVQPAFK